MVPIRRMLIPNRPCSASSSGPTPSSMKLTGLIWMPTNFSEAVIATSPTVPVLQLAVVDEMGAVDEDVAHAPEHLHVGERVAVHGHDVRERAFLHGAEPVGVATQFGAVDR